MKSFIFGQTYNGLPIPAYQFGSQGPEVLILGGVHGDETEGVVASHALLKRFHDYFSFRLSLTLIPVFNLDGVLAGRRQNANGVDLNRNLPTGDWTSKVENPKYYPGETANSEPENQALVRYLDEKAPNLIVSLHSWKPMLNINGRCQKQAEVIHKYTGYAIEESVGYPTPGCLGTYAGLERDMATITYEFEREIAPSDVLKIHVPAIIEALKVTEQTGS